tara:strand:+ start:83 stop:1243 length:1161 start_codon:yes stop_codon:yes gene_type:complete
MLLNNCATSINNNLEQSISNNYSSFDQALSVNKLFYAENKDKNELKVDRELILEALKYEFSDTKELNTLIALSQSDNLRPYGKKVIQDLIKNNNLLLKQNYASLNFNVDEGYKDLFLQAAMNLKHLKINLVFNNNQNAFIVNSDPLNENLPGFCESFQTDQLNSIEKAIFANNDIEETETLVIFENTFRNKQSEIKKLHRNIRTILYTDQQYEIFASDNLGITENLVRHKKIDALLPKININNTPRIRNDVKNIYFLLSYENAKGLVPAFRYNYSLDLNSYASINLIENINDVNKIVDFESLIMPVPNQFRDNIFINQFSDQSNIKNRLIYDNLHDLILILALKDKGIKNAIVNGRSGILFLNQDQCILRELPLKRINADGRFMLP